MGWVVKYHRDAKKFLKRLDNDRREILLSKLNEFKECLNGGYYQSNVSI